MNLKRQLKAACIASADKGINVSKILDILQINLTELLQLVDEINQEDDVIQLKFTGKKIFANIKAEYFDLLKKLDLISETKLSPSLQETLAIVAYLSPCKKSEIDFIRGVESSHTILSLMNLGYIQKTGDDQYELSEKALSHMQITEPSELPNYDLIRSEFQVKLQNLKL